MCSARAPGTRPSWSPATASRRTASSGLPRTIADAACAWPPPPSRDSPAAMSRPDERLRATANTRPSISTSISSASHSTTSVTLVASVEMPST